VLSFLADWSGAAVETKSRFREKKILSFVRKNLEFRNKTRAGICSVVERSLKIV
jgi:hypothetical protein